MTTAGEIMDPRPGVVDRELPVAALAELLLQSGQEGVCVVEDGALVGVVTAMDLVYKEKNVHLPTIFAFMDAVIPVGWKRAEAELEKIAGLTVGEIMTADPVTVPPEADLHTVATLMVERRISMLPVVRDGAVVGVVDKRAVLAAAFPRKTD